MITVRNQDQSLPKEMETFLAGVARESHQGEIVGDIIPSWKHEQDVLNLHFPDPHAKMSFAGVLNAETRGVSTIREEEQRFGRKPGPIMLGNHVFDEGPLTVDYAANPWTMGIDLKELGCALPLVQLSRLLRERFGAEAVDDVVVAPLEYIRSARSMTPEERREYEMLYGNRIEIKPKGWSGRHMVGVLQLLLRDTDGYANFEPGSLLWAPVHTLKEALTDVAALDAAREKYWAEIRANNRGGADDQPSSESLWDALRSAAAKIRRALKGEQPSES